MEIKTLHKYRCVFFSICQSCDGSAPPPKSNYNNFNSFTSLKITILTWNVFFPDIQACVQCLQCTNHTNTRTHTHTHTPIHIHTNTLSHSQFHASFFPLLLTVQVVEGASRPKTTGKLHFRFINLIVIWITADWRQRVGLFLPAKNQTECNDNDFFHSLTGPQIASQLTRQIGR